MAKHNTLRLNSVSKSEEHLNDIVADARIDMREIKSIVQDLMVPSAFIYWSDLILSTGLGWGFFVAAVYAAPFSLTQIACVLLSSFLMYRALVFNHEICHVQAPWVKAYSVFWNAICGIALLQPTSFYGLSHLDHHKGDTFATMQDPRYLPLGLGPRAGILIPLLVHNWFVPLLLAFRFMIIAPVSILIGGKFRDAVLEKASTFAMNLEYKRRMPSPEERRAGVILELSVFVFWCVIIGLSIAGIIPPAVFVVEYAVLFTIMVVNYVRSLTSHLYIHQDEKVAFKEQILDSVSIVGPFSAAAIFAPVGLRYHSLHHLVPSMPYHTMGEAHRRLMIRLPSNHPYKHTLRQGMWEVLTDIFRRCSQNEKSDGNKPDVASNDSGMSGLS